MIINDALHPQVDMDKLYVCGCWMSVEDVVRVEKHSLTDYLKTAKINSDKVLGVFVKQNGKQELITEQNNMKWDSGKPVKMAVSVKN